MILAMSGTEKANIYSVDSSGALFQNCSIGSSRLSSSLSLSFVVPRVIVFGFDVLALFECMDDIIHAMTNQLMFTQFSFRYNTWLLFQDPFSYSTVDHYKIKFKIKFRF